MLYEVITPVSAAVALETLKIYEERDIVSMVRQVSPAFQKRLHSFADLHHPEYWDLDFVQHSPLREAYRRIANSIADSLDFFEA